MKTLGPMLWVVVTGGRAYGNKKVVDDALDGLKPNVVVQGDASGADALARGWARRRAIPFLSVPADWFGYSKAAGPRRNTLMLDLTIRLAGAENIIVAVFPGGVGTDDCVGKAQTRGLKYEYFK
jgi:SLOG family YspA-like protein